MTERRRSNYSSRRRIFLNSPPTAIKHYPANEVRTSKYTLLTFLPKNIFQQFHGLANFYFLGVIVLQAFPQFSQVGIIVPTLPLVIIVAATAIKDGIEDLKRHSADDSVNRAPAYLLDDWKNVNMMIRPGQINILIVIDKIMAYIFGAIGKVVLYVKKGISDEKGVNKDDYPSKLSPMDYIMKTSEGSGTLDKGAWSLSEWKSIHVGDFILLRNNDRIPADVVVISTGEPDCACYIETKNLDGETNLKIKRGIRELGHIKSPADCKSLLGFLDAELPNDNLYTFNGALSYEEKVIPIGPSGLLLRGCVLRNTEWLIAMVIYTGNDTKIMLNSGATPSKRSRIDKQINPMIILNAFTLILFCLICAVCAALYDSSFIYESASFLSAFSYSIESPLTTGYNAFFNCLIVFQNIIPIALYISLEITKLFQVFYFISSFQSSLIHLDLDMFDEDTQQSVQPKSWNLCDDLGQIEYIFSDKTGTLTSNMMDFKKASIGGVTYGKWNDPSSPTGNDPRAKEKLDKEKMVMKHRFKELFNPEYFDDDFGFVDASLPLDISKDDEQAIRIKVFFSVLAICHTVLVEKPDPARPNQIVYRAQSPDEAALVNAAKNVGFACLTRTDNKVDIDFMGVVRAYTILNILEFSSDRKRMSVIVLRPEGDILLMCKGADSVIYERLDKVASALIMESTSNHLSGFANEGLRTLCLAYRRIPKDEYDSWSEKYHTAQAAIENREAQCDALADQLEKNLILMGATAIEDKLQEGVPDCIALLAKAGIKLWGDKVETAINIGFSCNLLLKSMTLIVIQADSIASTIQQMKDALERFWDKSGNAINYTEMALVIDGESLKFALEDPCKSLLLELGCRCKAVLCCRVSPLQKALVVKMVREGLGAMCLAIGDGANDVSMIQEADIGIGISGKEGLQAVMASDYAISQFRFLSKLLLVHGRWAYVRSAELVLNYFYKNITWLLILFWHQFYCGFTVGLVMDYNYSIFFNTLFTFFPTFLVGIFDQDLNAVSSMRVPQLYLKGIRQEIFSIERFWSYMFHGLYQSIILYFGVMLMITDTAYGNNGFVTDAATFSSLLACCAILVINIFGTTNWFSWTWINLFSFSASIAIWIIYLALYSTTPGNPTFGMTTAFSFYIIIISVTCLALIPRVTIKYVQQTLYPEDTDIVLEMQECCMSEQMCESNIGEVDMRSGDSYSKSNLDSISNNLLPKPGALAGIFEKIAKPKFYNDGFEAHPAPAPPSTSADVPVPHKTRTTDLIEQDEKYFGQSIHKSVHKAGLFLKHLLPGQDKQIPLVKACSIVYMNGNMESLNTGYAFSHDGGMQDIITPHRMNLEPIDENGLTNCHPIIKRKRFPSLVPTRLRHFSRTIQSALGQSALGKSAKSVTKSSESVGPEKPTSLSGEFLQLPPVGPSSRKITPSSSVSTSIHDNVDSIIKGGRAKSNLASVLNKELTKSHGELHKTSQVDIPTSQSHDQFRMLAQIAQQGPSLPTSSQGSSQAMPSVNPASEDSKE